MYASLVSLTSQYRALDSHRLPLVNKLSFQWKGYIPSEERLPKNFNSNLTVVECCDECACDITCPSRVVQVRF